MITVSCTLDLLSGNTTIAKRICLVRIENPDNSDSWNYITMTIGTQQQVPLFSHLINNI